MAGLHDMAARPTGSLTEVAEALLRLGGCPRTEEIARETGLQPSVVRGYLDLLSASGGLEPLGDGACVTSRAELAAFSIRLGADPARLSRLLSWRDFEALAASALEEAGFEVSRNLRLPGRGGMEVDVVGYRGPYAVAVDCKRWSYRVSSPSRVAEAARAQRARAERLASVWGSLGLPPVRYLVPALLVLREDLPRIVEGVAVVPAVSLKGFIRELEAVADEVGVKVA